MANRLCLACGSDNHSVGDCPFKRTWNVAPTPPVLSVLVRRNLGLAGRGAPLPPWQHAFSLAQKEARTKAVRGRGQAYNLTAEEAKASREVVTGKILVHLIFVLSLFDSSASHYFMLSRFTVLHSIPLLCMSDQWKLSTGMG